MPWPVTLNGITFTDADFAGTAYVTGLPKVFENAVTHLSNVFVATSATSVAVGTGSKTFTATTGRPYAVGTFLRIASTASPSTVWMDGAVTAYNSGTGALTVAVTAFAGSGTLAAWTINLSGGGYAVGSPVTIAQGGTGSTTAAGALTALGALPLAGGTMTGALTLSGDPTADTHAASMSWVQSRMAKDSCRVATTANLTATAATSTLTNSGTLAALAIDGVTLALGDRVLVKNQSTTAQNGIYSLTTLGTASVAWVLTRVGGGNVWTDLVGALTGVEEGTANANTLWWCTANRGGTLGTTGVAWQLVTNAQVAALGAVSTTGLLNRTGANAFSTVAVSSTSSTNSVAQRDASANIMVNDLVTGNGTATAPAIRPSSDTNTGIRFAGNDIIHLITGGSDRLSIIANGEIQPGSAGNFIWTAQNDHYCGYRPAVDHAAGNPANQFFGIADGNGWTGLVVSNLREGSFNSQQVDIRTAKGSVSLATTKARFLSEGHTCLGANAAVSVVTPGYNGDTNHGTCFWNSGRMFVNMDDFSQINLQRAGGATTGNILIFSTHGAVIGAIWSNGTSTSYNTTSDYRLKQDAEPLTGALDRLDLLQPRRFRFKADPSAPKVDGFFAHEAAIAVPEAVTGEQDATDFGGNPEYQSIDQSKLVPLLVAAVKELRAQVAALQAQ